MQSKRRTRTGAETNDQTREEAVDRLAKLLPEGASHEAAQGLHLEELTGPGGLSSKLAGRVLEAALQAELTEHFGHPSGAPLAGFDPASTPAA